MRLRSRDRQGKTDTIINGDKANIASERTVLGDVSNKRAASILENVNDDAKERAMKKLRSTDQLESSDVLSLDVDNKENGVADNDTYQEGGRAKRKRETTNARSSRRKVKEDADNEFPLDESFDGQGQKCMENRENHFVREEREESAFCNHKRRLIPREYCLPRIACNANNTYTNGLAPHDEECKNDVLMVSEYVSDLFQHLYDEESKCLPKMYMNNQRDINARMRAILIDWLVEVHMKFRLVPDTLYLCVNIIDRYCSLVQVARNKLQLVGVTALFIASKYEDIYPPEVRECVFMTDKAYQKQEIIKMEKDILNRLRFKITVPTAFPFLKRFLHLSNASALTSNAANYYMERTLQEHDMLRYRPSLVSAAAVILALNNPDVRARENASRVDRKVFVSDLKVFS